MTLVAALVATWSALAPLTAPADPTAIAGGQSVETCGWPSVVVLRGNGYICSGNLIHPEIVATAAHCIAVMEPETEVEFGDTANTAHPKVEVEYCTGSPDFVDNGDGTIPFDEVGNDWGFCKLASPVTDVEPIPPIYGCELDLLVPGAEIVRVGFGRESLSNDQFFKRWVETQVNTVEFTGANGWPTQLSEGGGGEGTCPGDSGGPSFLRIPGANGGEDSWRMVAIQSTQPLEDGNGNEIECGDAPNNTAVISQGVELIESMSGVDVTPCFSTDGQWEPTFECQGFPIDPGAGGGTWAMGCEAGPLSGFSAACGIAFDDANPDAASPSVTIVEPENETELDYDGAPVVVHVVAEADDGDGWGVASVDLVILDDGGVELGRFTDLAAPWEWDPEFPQGAFVLRADATDNAGLAAASDEVWLYVGVDAPTGDSSGGDDAADGTDTAASSEGGGDELGDDDGGSSEGGTTGGGAISGGLDGGSGRGTPSGCGCTSGSSGSGAWALFGLGFAIRRRRGRAR